MEEATKHILGEGIKHIEKIPALFNAISAIAQRIRGGEGGEEEARKLESNEQELQKGIMELCKLSDTLIKYKVLEEALTSLVKNARVIESRIEKIVKLPGGKIRIEEIKELETQFVSEFENTSSDIEEKVKDIENIPIGDIPKEVREIIGKGNDFVKHIKSVMKEESGGAIALTVTINRDKINPICTDISRMNSKINSNIKKINEKIREIAFKLERGNE